MPELIRIGTLELRFLRDKHETRGSLDLMEMTVPPRGQMPVAHYHRDWDRSVYGLEGTITFTVDGTAQDIGPGGSLFIHRGVVHAATTHSSAAARPRSAQTIARPGGTPSASAPPNASASSPASGPTATRYPAPAPNASVAIQAKATL